MVAWTLVVHVFGLVLWVGGLLAVSLVLLLRTRSVFVDMELGFSNPERTLLRAMADPGAALTLLAGGILVASNPSYYLHARWLRYKLVGVVFLAGLHVVVGRTSKSWASGGSVPNFRNAIILLGAILLVFLLILAFTLPGEVFLT